NDTVTFASANNNHLNTDLTVTTGAGTDAVNVTGPVSLAGRFTVVSRAITVSADVTSTGAGGVPSGVTFTNSGVLSLAGGTTSANGGLVRTTGAQSYGDPVTLGAAATQFTSLGNAAVGFAGTLTGASAVTVTTGGTTTFGGAVNVASLLTNGGGTTVVG